jgi:hypothetical protein
MAASEKARLFSRLHELHSQQGKTWKEIAHILEEEGYEEKGETLTDNALRKRFTRWSKSEVGVPGESSLASEPVSTQEQGTSDFDRMQKHRMDSALKQFGKGGSVPAGSREDAIASLVTLNNQLVEQLRESNRLMQRLGRRLAEQESKTSHTGVDVEPPVTSRDLLELLKEIGSGRQQMQFIEEERRNYVARAEVQQLLEELIPDRIDAELKAMLDWEPVRNLISQVLDERLKAYMGGITVKEQHSGPGRGRSGKTHKKFSASLPEDLFEEVKSLPGMFSAHLDAALRLYLKMTKGDEQ